MIHNWKNCLFTKSIMLTEKWTICNMNWFVFFWEIFLFGGVSTMLNDSGWEEKFSWTKTSTKFRILLFENGIVKFTNTPDFEKKNCELKVQIRINRFLLQKFHTTWDMKYFGSEWERFVFSLNFAVPIISTLNLRKIQTFRLLNSKNWYEKIPYINRVMIFEYLTKN